MPPGEVYRSLSALALRVGLEVREDAFDPKMGESKGGLCWLRGRPIVVVDGGAPLMDKIVVLARALSAFDLEVLYIPPLLRARIDAVRAPRRRGASDAPGHGAAAREDPPVATMAATRRGPADFRTARPGLKKASPWLRTLPEPAPAPTLGEPGPPDPPAPFPNSPR